MMTTLSATTMTLGERLAYAGRMTLIGMVTVFAALAILWGALALFRLVLDRVGRKKGKAAATTAPAPIPAAPAAPSSDEGAVVAAITAAIAEVLAAENGGVTPQFRVVSYRRTRHSRK